MRRVWQMLSVAALAGTILPSFFYLAGRIDLDDATTLLLAATVVWFISAPMWTDA